MRKIKKIKHLIKLSNKKPVDSYVYDTESGSDIRIFKNGKFIGFLNAPVNAKKKQSSFLF